MKDLNEQFPDVSLNLEILAEECAEVIQIKSKIVRFGLNDYHPKNGVANRECLVQELGDVLALVEVLKANQVFTEAEIELAIKAKLKKMPKWYAKYNS